MTNQASAPFRELPGRVWEDVTPGEELAGFVITVNAVRLATTPSVTLDAFAGHVDVDYARAQGHPATFMNSLPMLGLIDRLATDWAGPRAFICRHRISLALPVYCGSTVTVSGRVASVDPSVLSGFGRRPVPSSRVEVEALLTTERGLAGKCEVTVALPRRSG